MWIVPQSCELTPLWGDVKSNEYVFLYFDSFKFIITLVYKLVSFSSKSQKVRQEINSFEDLLELFRTYLQQGIIYLFIYLFIIIFDIDLFEFFFVCLFNNVIITCND